MGHETTMTRTRLKRWYTMCAVLLLTTILLFVTANLFLWCVDVAAHLDRSVKRYPDVLLKYGVKRVTAAYPGWTERQVVALLKEMWNRTDRWFEYEPVVEYRERPFHGNYLRISANGYREGKESNPWPPDPAAFNVMVFGGSTAFGYGLPDEATIPSWLQQLASMEQGARRIAVYNFSRGGIHEYA